jgi:hypothetical protein
MVKSFIFFFNDGFESQTLHQNILDDNLYFFSSLQELLHFDDYLIEHFFVSLNLNNFYLWAEEIYVAVHFPKCSN